MKYYRIYISREEKLWFWLVGGAVLLLMFYIMALNIAVSNAFERGEMSRDMAVLRQDLQDSEEQLTSKLTVFYDEYSGLFSKSEVSKQEFVTRQQNLALSSVENFR
ncbi:hypothetical protein HYT00_01620 [Candidatus Giovannonibacteria bacterium]|nr:hypothetical protein [Candidatus Giovannonibacteria bacterium]